MFARASSLGKPGGLASMENVRGSGRGTKQSPVGNRRLVCFLFVILFKRQIRGFVKLMQENKGTS